MSAITLYSSEYITVEYLPDKKIIYHVVHKPIGGQHLRDDLNAGTAAMEKYGACKWLSDDRKNGPLPADDVEWGDKDWNPRTIKIGWKYWALVVPNEVISAGAMTPVIEHLYELGLVMRVFTTAEKAVQWLESKENVPLPKAD
jgi:hypothetical protein